jgi:hypothetical protein
MKSISLPSSLEVLCRECFCGSSVSSLTFESDSKLTRIESEAFSGCKALKSICLPQSIQRLDRDWYLESSLARVIFESSASLRTMIERKTADLQGRFEIDLVDWDGVMNFPGYSVCAIPSVENYFRLVKNK